MAENNGARYAVVDLYGAIRDRFSNRAELRAALRGAEDANPGAAAELYVLAFDAAGRRLGAPERGDEIIAPTVVVTRPVNWAASPPRPHRGGPDG